MLLIMCCFDTLSVLKSKITHHWGVKIAHHFLLCIAIYKLLLVNYPLQDEINNISSYIYNYFKTGGK